MSTQTGIRPDQQLSEFFGQCRSGLTRLIKVKIENEAMVLDRAVEARGTWQQDWDQAVLPMLDRGEPCYLLYRMDEKTGGGYQWLLISWSPDESKVRHKMLYASSKATLKMEFGGGQIKDDLFGNVKVRDNF